MIRKLFFTLLSIVCVTGVMAQTPIFTVQQNMAPRRIDPDSGLQVPVLNTNRTFVTNRDSIGQLWMRTDSAKIFGRFPGNVIRALAGEDTTRALRASITAGAGNFIANQTATAENKSFRISGQGIFEGTNGYKIFVNRANTSQTGVIGFRNLNTGDTVGYVGLHAIGLNDLGLNSLRGKVTIRVPRDSSIILGQLNPELPYVVVRSGKIAVADTVNVTPAYPLHITSYQDTSITTRRKVYAGGVISTAGIWANVRTVSATSTVLADDHTLIVNTSGGNVTLTLPPASSSNGKIYYFKKASTSNTLTLQGNGAEQIDNANTYVITSFLASVMLHCNGTTWYVF